jgi:hypothetical protein
MSTNKYDNQFNRKFSELKIALNRHEKNISNIVNDFLANPKQSAAYWSSVKTQLNQEYRQLYLLTSEWAGKEIPKQYRFVLREQMAKAKSLKSITNEAKKTISQLLKSNNVRQIQAVLAQSAIDDIASGLLMGRRDLNRLIAQTRQALITESAIDVSLIQQIEAGNIGASKILSRQGTVANRLLNAAQNNRYMTIMDVNGNPRSYRITDYSEIVYRTKWHAAQSAAVKTNNANWGTDLIRVSNHNTITEICQQYEGKIFSLTGKNKDFPIADQTPPYHPQCLHYITTTFEEALKVQGNYNEYSQFSKGKIDQPPGQNTYIPLKKRNAIVNKTVKDVKGTELYKKAKPRRKRRIIRDSVSQAIGKAA